jgi:hypothetical protein
VSNFTTATLDLPVASPQANADLTFRAFTERIPPLGTPVRLVLAPKLMEKKKGAQESAAKPPQESKDSSTKKRTAK